MRPNLTILVYRFSIWDRELRMHHLSDAYATLEAIQCGLGIPVHAEWRRVPIHEVVGGMWRPPAVLR